MPGLKLMIFVLHYLRRMQNYYVKLNMKKKYLSYKNLDFEHTCVLNLHVRVLNWHAVRDEYNTVLLIVF
jgi:hypothetical protein